MKQIQRYDSFVSLHDDCKDEMKPTANGEWVRYDDYVAARDGDGGSEMKTIARYEFIEVDDVPEFEQIQPSLTGEYVRYDDHVKAIEQARAEATEAAFAEMRRRWDDIFGAKEYKTPF